jgi:3-oxoacyl-[acyl-carrier protein] reductase
MLLRDSVTLITGASRGIGAATAELFAREGARLFVTSHKSQDALHALAERLSAQFGVQCTPLSFDVQDGAASQRAYQTVFKEARRLDVLVNNAGVMRDGVIGMITDDLIQENLRVNVAAMIQQTQLAARLMARNKHGAIVNVSSIVGIFGAPGQVVYAASKAAVIGLTRAAAKELAPQGIRVNAVAPGMIQTDLLGGLRSEVVEDRRRSIGLGRLGEPREVAQVIAFLASDQASYVTGQVVGIDGGMVL